LHWGASPCEPPTAPDNRQLFGIYPHCAYGNGGLIALFRSQAVNIEPKKVRMELISRDGANQFFSGLALQSVKRSKNGSARACYRL
jgi:hypothetical protein